MLVVLNAQRDSIRSADREASEQRITIMLISVVVVFLVCQLPQAILKLYTVYVVSTPGALTAARRLELAIGGNFCNLLVIINSAVNFVLYSALSAKFRQTFERTFCSCCVGGAEQVRRRSSASVTGITSVPLTNASMMDAADDPQRRRRPPTLSTDIGHDDVTATSGHGPALLHVAS